MPCYLMPGSRGGINFLLKQKSEILPAAALSGTMRRIMISLVALQTLLHLMPCVQLFPPLLVSARQYYAHSIALDRCQQQTNRCCLDLHAIAGIFMSHVACRLSICMEVRRNGLTLAIWNCKSLISLLSLQLAAHLHPNSIL